MKRVAVAILLIAILFMPVAAIDYGPATYIDSDSDAIIQVEISADTPWTTPFTEEVSIDIDIEIDQEDVTQVNITGLVVSVQRYEEGTDTYSVATVETVDFDTVISNADYANLSETFTMTGSIPSYQCYFAIALTYSYTNSSGTFYFQSTSPDNLLGSFTIAPGTSSAQFLVGVLVILVSTIIVAAGAYAAKKSKEPKKKRVSIDD